MRITIYLHGDKESNCDAARSAGLTSCVALDNFAYAGYELECEYEVDPITGVFHLVTVDGKELK